MHVLILVSAQVLAEEVHVELLLFYFILMIRDHA